MNKPASHDSHTFRWSWRKIRRYSITTGITVFFTLALWGVLVSLAGSATKWGGHFTAISIVLSAFLATSIFVAIVVGGMLSIGRACTGTIVSTSGLLVQQALWQTTFIRWEAIESVAFSNLTGWNYLYLKRVGSSSKVGLSIELDDPGSFLSLVEMCSPVENPVRRALQLHLVPTANQPL